MRLMHWRSAFWLIAPTVLGLALLAVIGVFDGAKSRTLSATITIQTDTYYDVGSDNPLYALHHCEGSRNGSLFVEAKYPRWQIDRRNQPPLYLDSGVGSPRNGLHIALSGTPARAYLVGQPIRSGETIRAELLIYCKQPDSPYGGNSERQRLYLTSAGVERAIAPQSKLLHHHHDDPLHPDAASATHEHPAVDLSGYALSAHEHDDVPAHRHNDTDLYVGELFCESLPKAYWDSTRTHDGVVDPALGQVNVSLLRMPQAARGHCCIPEEPGHDADRCFNPPAEGQAESAPAESEPSDDDGE